MNYFFKHLLISKLLLFSNKFDKYCFYYIKYMNYTLDFNMLTFWITFLTILFTTIVLYCYANFIKMNFITKNSKKKIDYININSKNIKHIIDHLKYIYQQMDKNEDVSKMNNYLEFENSSEDEIILNDLGKRYEEMNKYNIAIRLYYKLLILNIKRNNQDRKYIIQIMNKLMILYSEIGDNISARFMFEQSMNISRYKNADINLI